MIEIKDMITIGFSFTALVISIGIYMQSKKNHKQNILVSKIERILFIIEELATVYSEFLGLTHPLHIYYSDKKNDSEEINNVFKKYLDERKELSNRIEVNNIIKYMKELEVLTRAYLSRDTQYKILSFNRMFMYIINYTMQMQHIYTEIHWKEGFPAIDKVNEYADELYNILIDGIGFAKGIKNFRKELRDYSENEFKKDMGLVNTKGF